MTPNQAIDEILAVFKSVWDDTGYIAIYDDVPGSIPQANAPWARVTVKFTRGKQASLSDAIGQRKFSQQGILAVQVFAPVGDGGTRAFDLAQLLLVAYCRTHGSVWFKRQSLNNVGRDGAFQQVNVTTVFSYDDTR